MCSSKLLLMGNIIALDIQSEILVLYAFPISFFKNHVGSGSIKHQGCCISKTSNGSNCSTFKLYIFGE